MSAQPGQAESVAIPKRWPLITTASNRGESFLQDSRLVNAYAEKDQNSGEWIVQKRPGLALSQVNMPLTQLGSKGLGIYNWDVDDATVNDSGGDTYTVWGGGASGYLYRNGILIDNQFNPSLTGYGRAFFIETEGTNRYMVFSSINGPVKYIGQNDVNTIFTAPTAPVQATAYNVGMQILNGIIYVMDSAGYIRNNVSADDPTSWDATNFLQARAFPGKGVALAKQLTYIVALKTNSTEIFYDNGANQPTGTPLAPVQDAVSEYGCGYADSVQSIDGLLVWMSTNRTTIPQIVLMTALHVQVVSTPPIERLLEQALRENRSVIFAAPLTSWVVKFSGHRWYGITLPNMNVTLVYDLDQKLWYQWTDPNGNYWNVASFAVDRFNQQIAQQFQNGFNVYTVGNDKKQPTDVGGIIPVDIYTPNYDAGTRRGKYLSQMTANADQVPGSSMQARWNENDFDPASWSNFREFDLSRKKPMISNCGSFTRRSYHFRHACPTAFRLTSMDLELDIGIL